MFERDFFVRSSLDVSQTIFLFYYITLYICLDDSRGQEPLFGVAI